MPSPHSIRVALAAAVLALPLGAAAQPPAAPVPLQETGATNFTIFIGGRPIGPNRSSRAFQRLVHHQHRTPGCDARDAERGGAGAPSPPGGNRHLALDALFAARRRRSHADGRRHHRDESDGTAAGQPVQKTDTVDPNALLVLPTNFFGPYEAVAARLKTAAVGSEIPAYIVPQMSIRIVVGESSAEQIQTTARLVRARRTRIAILLPAGRLDADLWTDDNGSMIRFSVPLQSVEVVREDIAAVSSRSVTISRPNDQQINIPSNGFSLAGTLSRPAQSTTTRLPAVVLVGGSGPTDRDSLVAGIPIFGQIADALANAGYIVVRYDKRGIGQSGGRAEAATLTDYADDVRAAVKLLADRKDVDPKRIAVIGHSEGGLVALMAAAKDKKIAGVGLIATPGTTYADVALAQQKRALDRLTLTPEERQAKVDEQKKIHEAVITGKGLELLPPNVRRSVDNGEYQSLLVTDPAKVMSNVRQPLLIVQGSLDTQVEPGNADVLDGLARKRKNAPAVEVVKVPGVNHLLVPATSGEVSEYADIKDKKVSSAVTEAIVTWLNKTLSDAR
jgi:pimeloyl-ACP methyl ester carboxylesterase